MKKSNLLKVFSILVLSVMAIFVATSVNAADFTDISETLANNATTGNNSTSTGNNTNAANSNTNNTNANANTNNSNSNTNRTNSNNSSIYNNSSLPKTGIGDSLPIAALVVVFGISAVYAYKKIKDYRNI